LPPHGARGALARRPRPPDPRDYDGCGSFAAGPLADERPIRDGGAIAVQPEHPYGARLVIDASVKLVEVAGEGGRPIDHDERSTCSRRLEWCRVPTSGAMR